MPIDKHPPKNWSTNKRVKAPEAGKPGMGGLPKTAKGPKRVKVGDKNTTSAKVVRPTRAR